MGGGFAGLSAVRQLRRFHKDMETVLVDRRETTEFLPLLPDIVGGRISVYSARWPLAVLADLLGFRFVHESAVSADFEKRRLTCWEQELEYDALILAAGSETEFYGNKPVQQSAFRLDDCDDAEHLAKALGKPEVGVCVIAGGGYTGVELAAQIRRRFMREKRSPRIVLVEKDSTILRVLPDWMIRYVKTNLRRLKVDVFENTELRDVHESEVTLSNGMKLAPAVLVWTAGVKACALPDQAGLERASQKRAVVDAHLKARENVFVAGDSACVMHNSKPLRMSVQNAIAQGACAAINAAHELTGQKMRAYWPADLGFVLPMANGRSCGNILGLNIRGLLPGFLHYVMCLYRGQAAKQKRAMLRDLIRVG